MPKLELIIGELPKLGKAADPALAAECDKIVAFCQDNPGADVLAWSDCTSSLASSRVGKLKKRGLRAFTRADRTSPTKAQNVWARFELPAEDE